MRTSWGQVGLPETLLSKQEVLAFQAAGCPLERTGGVRAYVGCGVAFAAGLDEWVLLHGSCPHNSHARL